MITNGASSYLKKAYTTRVCKTESTITVQLVIESPATMTEVTVRKAIPEDAPAMMEVQLSCLTHSYPAVYSKILLDKWKSLVKVEHYEAKTKGTGWCFVAVLEEEGEEEVVGYGYLNTNEQYRIPKRYECDVQVESLYVSAYHHKRGIGQKILQELERTALEEKFTEIAILSSTLAVPFYIKMGYSIAEDQVWYDISKDICCPSKGKYTCDTKVLIKTLC